MATSVAGCGAANKDSGWLIGRTRRGQIKVVRNFHDDAQNANVDVDVSAIIEKDKNGNSCAKFSYTSSYYIIGSGNFYLVACTPEAHRISHGIFGRIDFVPIFSGGVMVDWSVNFIDFIDLRNSIFN